MKINLKEGHLMIDGLSHIIFIVSDLDKMEVILMIFFLDAKKSMTAVIEPIHC